MVTKTKETIIKNNQKKNTTKTCFVIVIPHAYDPYNF